VLHGATDVPWVRSRDDRDNVMSPTPQTRNLFERKRPTRETDCVTRLLGAGLVRVIRIEPFAPAREEATRKPWLRAAGFVSCAIVGQPWPAFARQLRDCYITDSAKFSLGLGVMSSQVACATRAQRRPRLSCGVILRQRSLRESDIRHRSLGPNRS